MVSNPNGGVEHAKIRFHTCIRDINRSMRRKFAKNNLSEHQPFWPRYFRCTSVDLCLALERVALLFNRTWGESGIGKSTFIGNSLDIDDWHAHIKPVSCIPWTSQSMF